MPTFELGSCSPGQVLQHVESPPHEFFGSNISPDLLKLTVYIVLEKSSIRIPDSLTLGYLINESTLVFFYQSQYSCQLGDRKYCIHPMWKVHCVEFKLSAVREVRAAGARDLCSLIGCWSRLSNEPFPIAMMSMPNLNRMCSLYLY